MNLFVQKSKSKNIAYVYHEKKNLFATLVKMELGKKEREINNS